MPKPLSPPGTRCRGVRCPPRRSHAAGSERRVCAECFHADRSSLCRSFPLPSPAEQALREARKYAHNFINDSSCRLMCDECKAMNPFTRTLAGLRFGDWMCKAHCRKTHITHEEYLRVTLTCYLFPWMFVPGFGKERVLSDIVHISLRSWSRLRRLLRM